MKFDIIIPMRCYCASAQALKSVKKRSRSLPFDWVGPLHTPDMMDRLPADEELQAALERLRKMYPEKNHRLLFVNLAETEEGKTGFEKREIGGGIDYYDCYRDRDAAFDENFPGFVYFKKNVEAVLKAYKVRKNVKDVMKKFAFKLLDALSRLVPSRRVREKTRMLYKEYK